MNPSRPKLRIVVAGATGLVGRELVKQLVELGHEPKLLVRRSSGLEGAVDVHFDYEAPDAAERVPDADVLFCALGTTRKKAGSDAAFVRVDRDYPLLLLRACQRMSPKPTFALVSSVGAERAAGLYLRTKHELEQEVFASGIPYVVARPSILLGEREESRPGESVGQVVLGPLLRGLGAILPSARRYAPISGAQVARALITSALRPEPPAEVLEGESLFRAGAG